MEATKLYTCLEAINDKGQPQYMIYSAKVSDLLCTEPELKPKFVLEKVISGFPSMGCGVFGSKIVLAGGVWGALKKRSYNLQLITYDTKTKLVSHTDFPPMRRRKFRPLVLQLCGRLYILDTSSSSSRWSFEIYYPTHKFWDPLSDPFNHRLSLIMDNKKQVSGRTPYNWFVFGKVLCMSMPGVNYMFLHHARQSVKRFQPSHFQSLPFRGMATTYWKPGFTDIVVISFSKGCVEGRRFNFLNDVGMFGEPTRIFDTDPYEQPDGELSSYFSDCGCGIFSLTTFDNVNMHVYMFKIERLPEQEKHVLNLALHYLVKHKYSFDDFSCGGSKILNITGCFVLATGNQTKRSKEAKMYRNQFSGYESQEKDIDVPSCYKTRDGSIKTSLDWKSDNSETERSDGCVCSDSDVYPDTDTD